MYQAVLIIHTVQHYPRCTIQCIEPTNDLWREIGEAVGCNQEKAMTESFLHHLSFWNINKLLCLYTTVRQLN